MSGTEVKEAMTESATSAAEVVVGAPLGGWRTAAARAAQTLGCGIVEAKMLRGGRLVVTVERMDENGGARLEDCERVSRQLSPLLAAERVNYETLEVSSPGPHRPLVTRGDFARFCGRRVRVEMKTAGRKFFAQLTAVEHSGARLAAEGDVTDIFTEAAEDGAVFAPFSEMARAELASPPPQKDFRKNKRRNSGGRRH